MTTTWVTMLIVPLSEGFASGPAGRRRGYPTSTPILPQVTAGPGATLDIFRPPLAARAGGANTTHRSDPVHDTADFADVPGPGNLRADYVLPSRGLDVRGGGVFWPKSGDPLSRLTGTFPFPSSDHRLVWLDLRLRR
ncbi:hypothetical protein ABGB07_15025 [Micromonosporaceae bacterium B7E4]